MAIRRGFRRNKVNIIQTKLDNVNYLKRQYNFKGLYHFTDFSNLKNILETGYLYSRNDTINKFENFRDGADPDIIGKLNTFGRGNIKNCVRFYYRPRVSTLYVNEGVKLKQYCQNTHIPMPVYLLFDENLVYSQNIVYSDGNATSKYTHFGNSDEFFINMDWRLIFSDGPYSNYIDYSDTIQNLELKRKRQAELLSIVPVSIEEYLKKIIFRCPADMQRAINVLGSNDKYEINSELFSDKNDVNDDRYKNNYIEKYDYFIFKKHFHMKMFFKYNLIYPNKFDIKADIIYSNNKAKTIEFCEKDYFKNKKIVTTNEGKKIYKKNDFGKDIIAISINSNIVDLIIEGTNIKKVQVYINNFLYIEEYYNNENEIRRI
ncbi:DUF4433 domain-containing protein [Intestinibacter bartlettii]|uniref:DUF4433 domain-containing protein n=1 Tax=Intestinibacter bartlettii TaxID=261299 RepID=UPI0008204469|nr:DUF4433 domain-containing protein [Intestinibacter bartlettii]SCI61398.1 Uncharacterised protein [uncultured Clostridium sp.]